jgi:Secretion system C-terminal sorting domain
VSWPVVVDSFYTPIQYIRNDATTVDSLIIEFTIAYGPTIHDTGTYNIQLPASGMFSNMTFDSAPRFGDVHYNSGCGMRPAYSGEPYINDCYFDSVFAPKWRYAFPLNATTASDTDSNGLLLLGEMPVSLTRNSVSIPRLPTAGLYSLPLDTILVNGSLLGLNPHVVSFVSFKSGHSGGTYPHGTSSNSGNYIKLFAGSPVGDTTWFMQSAHNAAYTYQGSYQASLYAINSERYNDTFFSMPTGAHDILVPAWELSPRFSVADQSFHVSSEIGWEGITDINDLRSLVTVYPDPASDILNVMVSPSRNDELTVILTNAAGQVVAKQVGKNPTGKYVFNTSALPNGVYIYSVICGGQKQSGRTLIMHQ